MNWGGSSKGAPQPPQQRGPPGPSMGDAPAEKGRSGMPPACPRCEVTKSQFNRTIQNYQKAYRKKVEGLKTELKATRNTNDSLRRQVTQLKSLVRLHAPSMLLGLAAGVLVKTYFSAIKRLLKPKQPVTEGVKEEEAQQEPQAALPADPTPAAAL